MWGNKNQIKILGDDIVIVHNIAKVKTKLMMQIIYTAVECSLQHAGLIESYHAPIPQYPKPKFWVLVQLNQLACVSIGKINVRNIYGTYDDNDY